MSKINAIRLINLNYNNNNIRISDEVFRLNGESTLLSLRNGGGKSVLVQMITAPFVHKQYRKTKDRPFESYFTTSKPTFIMVEWALDQGAGYCLTGMMVRKNQEAESSEALEIINFISEYESSCEQDIYHLPVIEKGKKEVVLKNFHSCKQLFESYKKDSSKKFFYYDMNHSAQSRQYFEKLSEYQIHFKEWETIILKVNAKESGLSELFSDCKNEKELLEKWFLDAVENKLNRDQNRIKEFQGIIEKYVRLYKENKSKIQRRDTILLFKEDMLFVEEEAKNYLETEQKVKASENQIACFIQELNRLEEVIKQKLQEVEQKKQNCEAELRYIVYEKLSMELHELEDGLKFRVANRDMIGMEKDALEEDLERIVQMLHLLDCAKQQEFVDEQKREYEFFAQRIEVYRKDEKELEPERNRLGGYLKNHYKTLTEHTSLSLSKKEEECEQLEQKRLLQKEKQAECQEKIEELLVKIAECNTRIKGFSQKEENFNQNYKEEFARNIVGEYEPGFLDIKKEQQEKEYAEIVKKQHQHMKQQGELKEKKHTLERKIEDYRNEKRNYEYEFKGLLEQTNALQKQLEERKSIMRYLEVDTTYLWQMDKLLEVADRKLLELDRVRKELEQEEHKLQKEWKKLTSSELLELPQEFKNLLTELELHPVYGMNWLEKNGYTKKQNIKMVRKQPFLPYSLILPKAEIAKLETRGKELYTSFPIPLIPREDLEKVLTEKESSVLNLEGISFYLWFNEQLLDKKALQLLVTQKDVELKKKREQIEVRKKEYQEYLNKKAMLQHQSLTKEGLEENQVLQEKTKEAIKKADTLILESNEELRQVVCQLEETAQTILREKQQIDWCQRREKEFAQFCTDYIEYQTDIQTVECMKQDKLRLEDRKKQAIAWMETCIERLKTIETQKQELLRILEEQRKCLIKYERYECLEQADLEKTIEELEARYEAITSKMLLQLQELEVQQQKARKNLDKANYELTKLQKKYQLKKDEWKSIVYVEEEELHQEVLAEDRRKKIKYKESLWNEEDKQIGIVTSKIADKKQVILEQCGKEKPLSRKDILTVDFEAKKNQLEYAKKELEKERIAISNHLQSLHENLTVFAEYQDFVITEDFIWEKDFSEMDAKQLREFAGTMRKDYRQEIENCKEQKDKLETQLNHCIRKTIYQEDYYRKPLEAMLSVVGKAELILAQLSTTIQSYDSQIAKLAVDISMVEKEKANIEGLLEDYIKDVHRNMQKIDNNSTITIRERAIKMLKLQLPDWEENEGLYQQRLQDFMRELTQRGIELYEKNENALDYFSTQITTKNLYDTVVGIGNIQIKLYKIEEQREYAITWAEVAKNSGGEGFLSAFVILSSLLHYMRRDETDVFADKNEGKVLVMDNPFAQTNASHLLKPLMDMAKKTNTQLVCLSGLGGDSIYSRFDNIYVLNLVSTSLQNGMQYVRGEHTRGKEEEIIVPSQIEVIGQGGLLF